MIRIYGSTDTSEYKAAERLRELVLAWDPEAHRNGSKHVVLLVGERVSGTPPVEVDLILIMWCEGKAKFPLVDAPSGRACVESLVLTIEVKDVDERRLQFRGSNVQIRYDGHWEEIGAQLHKQPHALKRHLNQRQIATDPFVSSVGWLRGIGRESIPHACTQYVGSNATFEDFVQVALLEGTKVEQTTEGARVRAIEGDVAKQADGIVRLFTAIVRPSRLDRRRVEAISKRWLDDQKYAAKLGSIMLIIQGAAGTGKTIALLRIARDLILERNAKVLFLTYNHALLSDLRRMIGHNPDLFGMASGADNFTLKTVDSFIHRLGAALQCDAMALKGTNYETKHQAIKSELLTLLEGDCAEYVAEIRAADPATFSYDFFLVDEGQDWPQDECTILRRLVGFERLLVATSPSQIQRGVRPTDWTSGLPSGSYHPVTLKKVRRLSEGLFRFSVDFLRTSGGAEVDEMLPDPDIAGGQVHVVTGDYFSKQMLHDELLSQLSEDDNAPIDMLFVVPPGDGAVGGDGQYGSFAARSLSAWGHDVWDGTRRDVKRTTPESVDQIRIVNYRSVRGLEGWTVVLLGFDRYYEWLLDHPAGEPEQKDLLADPTRLATYAAAQQLAIPMTRAVKNLIVEVRGNASPVMTWLKSLHLKYPELCTWHIAETFTEPRYLRNAPPGVRRVAEPPRR